MAGSERWRKINIYAPVYDEIQEMIDQGFIMMPSVQAWVTSKIREMHEEERQAFREWILQTKS